MAYTFIGNGFSTNGMTWQQILQGGFGIPSTTPPVAGTGTNGIR
jgi:hypothetical protein